MEEKFQSLKTTTEKLRYLLTSCPELATSQNKLFMTFYFYELGKNKMNEMSAYDFFLYLIDGNKNTINISSLSRIKRKVLAELKSKGFHFVQDEQNQDLLFKIKNF
jgi:hypothetical protein